MGKTSTVSARIDPDVKRKAESVFKELGLTSSQAITLFYKQVELQQGLPFAVRIPNDVTLQALEEARSGDTLESFNNVEELFEDLDI